MKKQFSYLILLEVVRSWWCCNCLGDWRQFPSKTCCLRCQSEGAPCPNGQQWHLEVFPEIRKFIYRSHVRKNVQLHLHTKENKLLSPSSKKNTRKDETFCSRSQVWLAGIPVEPVIHYHLEVKSSCIQQCMCLLVSIFFKKFWHVCPEASVSLSFYGQRPTCNTSNRLSGEWTQATVAK